MYSACAPKLRSLYPNTRSPGANEVTPSPTASTMPANSVPSTANLGRISPEKKRMMKGFPVR